MDRWASAKVGSVLVLAFAALLSVWWFMNRLDTPHDIVLEATFDDVKGVQKQAPVMMHGVMVGSVRKVRLDPHTLRPVLEVGLSTRQARIPANARIRITSGLLISTPQVEIYWTGPAAETALQSGKWPDMQVDAQPSSGLAQLSPDADAALKNLSQTAGTVNQKLPLVMDQVGGILNRTDATLANIQRTTERISRLTANRRIDRAMDAVLDNLEATTDDTRQMVTTMRAKVAEMTRSGGRVDELTAGLLDLLNKHADTADALRSAVTRLSEQVSDPRLAQSVQDTVEMANATLARFNQVAADIHQITGDPNVQSDLKQSLATLNETTREARELVDRVNAIVSRLPTSPGKPSLGIGRPEVGIDFLLRGKQPHFRSDVSARIPVGRDNAVHLGLYDFAESYRLNAQYETLLGNGAALRYGIYAGKLGVGLDWRAAPGASIHVNAFDPNRFEVDTRGLLRINNDFSLWLGVDDVFRTNTPLVGVRLTR